jgi:hypothetical protein
VKVTGTEFISNKVSDLSQRIPNHLNAITNPRLHRRMQSAYKTLTKYPLCAKTFTPISVIYRQYHKFNKFSTATAAMGGSSSSSAEEVNYNVQKSDDEWKAILSPQQVPSLN